MRPLLRSLARAGVSSLYEGVMDDGVEYAVWCLGANHVASKLPTFNVRTLGFRAEACV